MGRMIYVATKPARVGDQTIGAGELLPIESGRNFDVLVAGREAVALTQDACLRIAAAFGGLEATDAETADICVSSIQPHVIELPNNGDRYTAEELAREACRLSEIDFGLWQVLPLAAREMLIVGAVAHLGMGELPVFPEAEPVDEPGADGDEPPDGDGDQGKGDGDGPPVEPDGSPNPDGADNPPADGGDGAGGYDAAKDGDGTDETGGDGDAQAEPESEEQMRERMIADATNEDGHFLFDASKHGVRYAGSIMLRQICIRDTNVNLFAISAEDYERLKAVVPGTPPELVAPRPE